MSIDELTIRMAWVAGAALVALLLVGWRRAARAQPRPPGDPLATPRRVPHEVVTVVTEPYRPAGPLRRLWAASAGLGLAVLIGAVVATVTAFALAVIVTTLTNLLKQ